MNLKSKLTLIVLLCGFTIFAQEGVTLKGKVVDKKDNFALPGVNVLVVNSKITAATDMDLSLIHI